MKKHLEVTGIGNLVFYQTYLKLLVLKIPLARKTKTLQQLSDEIDENYIECLVDMIQTVKDKRIKVSVATGGYSNITLAYRFAALSFFEEYNEIYDKLKSK